MSLIVVMGSGETTPTMLGAHRDVLARTPSGPAVMLDTPFAFQTNREELVERARLYFAQSVGREVSVVRWPGDERDLALLDRACWAFAGPGSPTYALRQWLASPVPAALEAVVRRGGTLVLGSAAAVTVGSHAVPVYEIYKVGADPVWEPGLDLLGGLTGLAAAVIPHFDNREGGTHDTRYCYLGEGRLEALEAQLPEEAGVLGVDEHTAAILDVAAGRLEVVGNGRVSIRRRGRTTVLAAGESLPFGQVAELLRGEAASGQAGPAVVLPQYAAAAAGSLRSETERWRGDFESALERRDLPGCVDAVLGLEQAIAEWRADTTQSEDQEEARRVLRALVVRLGELAEGGLRDRRGDIAPYVELLLQLRATARQGKDFATSDLIRDALAKLDVEVRDTGSGQEWATPAG